MEFLSEKIILQNTTAIEGQNFAVFMNNLQSALY